MAAHADRVIRISDGHIVDDQPVTEARERAMSETVRVAFAGLTANKLRTGLTVLGLMIGVGSVIILIAVGTGSSSAVEKQIDALGSNVLLVTSGPTLGGLRQAATLRHGADGRRRPGAVGPLPGSRRPQRLAGGQRERHDAFQRPDHLLALVVRGHDAQLRAGAQLHRGRGELVHGRPGEPATAACSSSVPPWPRTCSRARTRWAARCRSTARAFRSSELRLRRGQTGCRTRTTWPSRRSPPCRTPSPVTATSTRSSSRRARATRSTLPRPR